MQLSTLLQTRASLYMIVGLRLNLEFNGNFSDVSDVVSFLVLKFWYRIEIYTFNWRKLLKFTHSTEVQSRNLYGQFFSWKKLLKFTYSIGGKFWNLYGQLKESLGTDTVSWKKLLKFKDSTGGKSWNLHGQLKESHEIYTVNWRKVMKFTRSTEGKS